MSRVRRTVNVSSFENLIYSKPTKEENMPNPRPKIPDNKTRSKNLPDILRIERFGSYFMSRRALK